MSSELRVNKLTSRSGVGTVTFNDSGLIITGIATAATLDITGNATIAGVLSYDDVTNVDSVGIITAQAGIRVTGAASSIGVGIANPAEKIDVAGSIQSDTGLKVAGHPVVGYANLGGGDYAARLGSTGSSTLNKTQIYARGSHVATFDGDSGSVGIGTDGPGRLLHLFDIDAPPLLIDRDQSGERIGAELRQSDTTDGNSFRLVYQSDTTGAGAASNVNFASIEFAADTHDQATRAGSIRFRTSEGGVGDERERLRIDTSGNMGLGTASPGDYLASAHQFVISDSASTGITIATPTSSSGTIAFADGTGAADNARGLIRYGHSSNSLQFSTNAAEVMRIDSSGRLLVGTTSDVSGGSTSLLQVVNQDNFATQVFARNDLTMNAAGQTAGLIRFMSNSNGGASGTYEDIARIHAESDSALTTGDKPGALVFSTTADGAASTTERMRIDSSGNMGLGTVNPVRDLQIGDNTDDHEIISLQTSTTGKGSIYFGDNAATSAEYAGMIRYDHSDNVMTFRTQSTERVRILSGGGVTFNGDTAQTNALDDYEEGTFTVGMSFGGSSSGVTASHNSGAYIKVGNKVTCWGRLTLTNNGTGTGQPAITGLPFTVANVVSTTSIDGGGHFNYQKNISGVYGPLTLSAYEGTTTALLYGATTTNGNMHSPVVSESNINNDLDCRFVISYQAA